MFYSQTEKILEVKNKKLIEITKLQVAVGQPEDGKNWSATIML